MVELNESRFGWEARFDNGQALFTAATDAETSTPIDLSRGNPRRGELFASLVDSLGAGSRSIADMQQVHGANVLDAKADGPLREGDALVATSPDIALTAVAADCVPIVISWPGGVATVHAGWRGLAGGVIAATCTRIAQLGGDQLSAAVGASARGCCYQVSSDVLSAIGESAVCSGSNLDTGLTAVRQLSRLGIDDVADVGECTVCASGERYFSYRRQGDQAGRQGVVAWLNR